MQNRIVQDSITLDETDLAIFHALELAPRASWAAVGQAVGVDAVTAARRWSVLEEAELAWVTAYPLLTRETVAMFLEIECESSCVRSVAAVIARCPHAVSVDIVSGGSDIFMMAGATDRRALSTFVLSILPQVEGVKKVTSHPVVAVHVDSGLVGAGSLGRDAREMLPTDKRGSLVPSTSPADDLDWALSAQLSRNGRQSIAALSRSTGASETTVKRRLSKLTSDGALHLRAVMAPGAIANHVPVWLGLQVIPGEIADALSTIGRLPGVKFAGLVAGPDNLQVKAVLPHIAMLEAFEARLHRGNPRIHIAKRMVVLEPVRHVSRVFDHRGRVSATVLVDIRT